MVALRSLPLRAPNESRLHAIIALQTAIVTAPRELSAVMGLIVERAQVLTVASGAVIELLDGAERVPAAASGAAAPMNDTGSMICVPLFRDSQVIGALKVFSANQHAFTEEDTQTLAILADLIAATMAHARQFEAAIHASMHDVLTQLPNRRSFEHLLGIEVDRHRRYGDQLSIAMLDLDGFKRANDTLGHAAGDAALSEVGSLLRANLRTTDSAFRLGGDEFAIVLPRTAEATARIPLLRCVTAINEARLAEGLIGVSHGLASAAGDSVAGLCARADAQLYEMKRAKKAAR